MSFLDLLNVPAISDPRISPDGASVVYVQDAPDWTADKRIGHIWRVTVDLGRPTQLTRGEHGESSPRWSPDGGSIAFLARRGDADETQAYLLPLDGGEARPLTDHATSVSRINGPRTERRSTSGASDPKRADQNAPARSTKTMCLPSMRTISRTICGSCPWRRAPSPRSPRATFPSCPIGCRRRVARLREGPDPAALATPIARGLRDGPRRAARPADHLQSRARGQRGTLAR